MDELDATEVPTVGERLRAAREAKGLSLDDVAAQTRIPRRHLESVENSEWDRLPAPTYTIGFAKSYASAVDLDRTEIGEDLRSEMGGSRAPTTSADVFEPADPARTMPRWLVLAAIIAVILVIVVMSWLSNRSLHDDNEVQQPAATAAAPQHLGWKPPAGPAPSAHGGLGVRPPGPAGALPRYPRVARAQSMSTRVSLWADIAGHGQRELTALMLSGIDLRISHDCRWLHTARRVGRTFRIAVRLSP